MKILFATSEIAPYSRTYGLADVAAALPDKLAEADNEVVCISPKYRTLDNNGFKLVDTGNQIGCYTGGKARSGRVFAIDDEFPAKRLFIGNDSYFDRKGLYQTSAGYYPDNAERFIFFSKAFLGAAKAIGFKPDIIHLNDWQTALAAVFLRTNMHSDTFFQESKTVLTIHNLQNQGVFWHWAWPMLNLGGEYFKTEGGLEVDGKINFLKGGIIFADALTTVSKHYSKEIRTEDYGHGLDELLSEHSSKLYGILNGIDAREWNPETDRHIAANYSVEDPSGKEACKADLQKTMKLPVEPGTPVIGVMSPLTEQKGIELILEGVSDLIKLKVQLIIAGSGDRAYENQFMKLAKEHPKSVGVKITSSKELPHELVAGCDFILMPSMYEPGGQNQMYSLTYGAIPIVRATGGLDDTVINFSEKTGRGNGFKFRDFASPAMVKAIRSALSIYRKNQHITKLRGNTFKSDFSWKKTANEYLKLYTKLTDAG